MNVHHDDNHEPIQSFHEVVSTWQPWRSATPSYYFPITSAPTLIATSTGFQNQPPNTNINFLPINLEMERFQLLHKLE
jgi:hypothetical protein